MEKLTTLEFSQKRIAPRTFHVVSVLLLLILSFAPSANALGQLCSMFGADCVSNCDASDVYTVQFELCDRPLKCCKRPEQTQIDRGSWYPNPYYKVRTVYRPPKASARPPTIPPTPTSTDNYVAPPPNVCGVIGHSRVRRIVNGVRARRCQYPWMALVVKGLNPLATCGASLISDRHVITAAHCFQFSFGHIRNRAYSIIVGEYDRNQIRPQSETRITKFSIDVHPEYETKHFLNDIAILTLDTPLDLSKYECLRPICLPDANEGVPVGTDCFVVGWGSVQRQTAFGTGPRTSSVLMETTIKVVREAHCQRMWKQRYHSDKHICAGDLSGQTDSCGGDSGGPLMCRSKGNNQDVYQLDGVVSLGNGQCAEPNVPALYTKVSIYRAWIDYMMRK